MRGNGTGGFYSDSHACVDCANRNMHHFKDLEPWPTLRLCRVGTVLAEVLRAPRSAFHPLRS